MFNVIEENKKKDFQTCFDLYNREEISLINKEMKLCILEDLITYSDKCKAEIAFRSDEKFPIIFQKLYKKYTMRLILSNNK